MSSLGALLTGRTRAGVYLWDGTLTPQAVARTAEVVEWSFGHVDGGLLTTEDDALRALAAALWLPETVERTGRAIWDALRHIPQPFLVLWDRWDLLAESDPAAMMRVLGLLGDRAADGGFAVLLRGDGPELGVPALPG